MRRLPIFFVLDCSESMIGENQQKLEEGMNAVIYDLKRDPHALESVYVSIIAFAGIAKTITNLIEVVSFYTPKLPIGSGTSLGAALEELMIQMDTAITKTTAEAKGDWKPIVFLLTDGKPTDNAMVSIQKWNDFYKTKAEIIAIAIGKYADINTLKKLTSNVLIFENTKENDFKKFINWMTASILSHSKSIGENKNSTLFENIDKSVLKKIDTSEKHDVIDVDCAVLVGKCQKYKKPYLIKYDCSLEDLTYELTGCYQVDDNYFKWSDTKPSDIKINTSELIGVPACPYCGAASAFALCTCGNLMCVSGPGESICPWCEKEVVFGSGTDDEDNNFDVNRGRG